MSPAKPPKKRQYKSGAQKRKERQETIARAVDAMSPRADKLGCVVIPKDDYRRLEVAAEGATDDGSAEFAALGAPPLDDPDTALTWVRKNQLVALHLATTRPLSKELLERIRWVKELGFTTGSTHSKSATEERLKKVEAELAGVKAARGAVMMERAGQIPRPETARGRGRGRGPRPVPGPGSRSTPGEDE